MRGLYTRIAHSDAGEIELLLKAVQKRYSELFPNWELILISIDRQDDRQTQLDSMIRLLEKMKDSPT